MATTIYSPQFGYGNYFRAKCTYTVTNNTKNVVISGTLYLQHKGPDWDLSSFYVGQAGVGWNNNTTVYEAKVRTSASYYPSKHTSWTDMYSKSFSFTINKTASAQTIKFYIGGDDLLLYDGALMAAADVKAVTVSVAALTSYNVTYNVNGGSGTFNTQKKVLDQTLYLYSNKPTRSGYSFLSWNTKADGTGTNYAPGAAYTANAALSLYAKWRLNNTITYNANGGTDAPATQEKQYQVSTTISTAIPKREGWHFVKWNTNASGTGTNYSPGQTYSTDANLTLYAIWEPIPKINTLTAVRCDANGHEADEGNYALVECNWMLPGTTVSGVVTGTITPQYGGQTTSFTFSGATSGQGGTASAIVGQGNGQYIDTDMQYTIHVAITAGNQQTERSVILTRAFFVMDFKAGGQAIGIGRAAPEEGLEVGYISTFDDDVNVLGQLNLGLDTGATSGVDKDIYDALVALGWTDCIV